MFTRQNLRNVDDYVCLSTDTKPTNVPNGTMCLEMDTKKIYVFDEANSTWREVS